MLISKGSLSVRSRAKITFTFGGKYKVIFARLLRRKYIYGNNLKAGDLI
jgi:hypothetical protein